MRHRSATVCLPSDADNTDDGGIQPRVLAAVARLRFERWMVEAKDLTELQVQIICYQFFEANADRRPSWASLAVSLDQAALLHPAGPYPAVQVHTLFCVCGHAYLDIWTDLISEIGMPKGLDTEVEACIKLLSQLRQFLGKEFSWEWWDKIFP